MQTRTGTTDTMAKMQSPASRLLARLRLVARDTTGSGREALTRKWLPLTLLGGLFVLGLLTICARTGQYGISLDEPLQQQYGRLLLAWYRTLGKDARFLTAFSADKHMPEHGGIFDALIAAVQLVFRNTDPWYVRHFVTALSGLLGVVAIALCGYELGGYWVALLAALGLWLYPRYYGAIYNNPKDVPAAVAMTFALWAALLLLRQWNQTGRSVRNGVLLGFFIGLAAAIRVNALVWYAILLVPLIAWWLLYGKTVWGQRGMRTELMKQGLVAGAIAVTSLLTLIALWPYVWLDPVHNLYQSATVLSHYPWNGDVLYEGVRYPASQLPRDYVPVWLFIASPPTLVALVLVGLGSACAIFARTRKLDARVGMVTVALILPLGVLVGLHAIVYDGPRQFLFLVPPMILLAVYGCSQVASYARGAGSAALRWVALGVLLATVASYGAVVNDMLHLSPYEYTYFSPLVGGLAGANGTFETDYWGVCSKQSADWLAQNYRRYTSNATPTVTSQPVEVEDLVSPYLPSTFRRDSVHPDFYISYVRGGSERQYATYSVVHTVMVEGVPLCVVKARSRPVALAREGASGPVDRAPRRLWVLWG